jgi:hypothetical protein
MHAQPVKHTTAPIRDEVPLPLTGPLAKFTTLVQKYLELLGEEEQLFKFKRHRAWQIVRFITDMWCHWFRSQSESYYGKYVYTNAFASEILSASQILRALDPT